MSSIWMRKKIARRSGFFILFRHFRKENVICWFALYIVGIAFFHTKIGNYTSERCRFFINSGKVTFDQYCDSLERNLSNFYYFMSHDIDGILINLRNKNVELSEEIENLKNLREENDELRKLLLLKKMTDSTAIAARVVSIFSNDFTQSFILNVGKADGIKIDDVVKNSDGLIGKIIEVYDDWSRALSIIDINSCIPVKIGEQQINAIMTGCNSNRLSISALHKDMPINEGDDVKTSGYGIHENISVGKIVSNGKKIMVQSPVDFSSLKYVIVLKKE